MSHRGPHAHVEKQSLLPQLQTPQIVSRYIVEDIVQRVLFVQYLDQHKKQRMRINFTADVLGFYFIA